MVGVVVISHSKELALSVCKLADQAASGAHIIGVGGAGDDGCEFGTDAVAIMEAIQEVYSDDGVLLLMDMGSALLSAQTALDLLGEEIASKITMCSAPLVEGAIIAAVQSNIGADIVTITQEVLQSLGPKQEQIGDVAQAPNNHSVGTDTSVVEIPSDAVIKKYIIRNAHGLHARPAACFVQVLAKYDMQAYVALQSSPNNKVSAKSLNAIAKMNVQQGNMIIVYFWGKNTNECIDELETLIVTEFGEKKLSKEEIKKAKRDLKQEATQQEIDSSIIPAPVDNTLQRLTVISRGFAIGQAWKVIELNTPNFARTHAENIDVEIKELDNLLFLAQRKISENIAQADNETTMSVLEMHQVMLQDPELISSTKNMICEHKYTAAYAWWSCCNTVSHEYKSIEGNQYLNERANDLIDIAIRVIRESKEVELPSIEATPKDAILFTDEITPDIISQIDLHTLEGIVTKTCGSTSHAAIIARTKNIPLISGFTAFDTLVQGTLVALDATHAKIFIAPTESIITEIQENMKNLHTLTQSLYNQAQETAVTLDGIIIECAANIGIKDDADTLSVHGADGVGLFRSEFLFLNRQTPPNEEEHYLNYSYVAQCLKDKPVIVRLLDIGGDKQVPYMNMVRENNPFLGMRGVRIYLKYKELLLAQIKAILRAAVDGNISMMIPMVSDVSEITIVKALVQEAIQELNAKNILHVSNVPLGIMVETPASVMSADKLAQQVDFFSIGTNDLTQYVLAIERESTELAYLYDACNVSVLRSISQVASSALQHHIPVSVCGEAGSDFEVIPLLLAMGIQKLSVTPSRIPAVKHLIRNLSVNDCKKLLEQVLEMDNKESIRELVRNTYTEVARLGAIL